MEDLRSDVVVVGGGLGGLATAALLSRGGLSVVLFERAESLGGRARTTETHGYSFNQGPHALYRAGAGMRVGGGARGTLPFGRRSGGE